MSEQSLAHSACLTLAGTCIPVSVKHRETVRQFGGFVCCGDDAGQGVFVPDAEWEDWLSRGGTDDGYGEYTCLTAAVSDFLLCRDRCVIHAAAFRHRGRAWLISGPSGAGKSTQVKMLQEIAPGEFGVICGDRPVLQLLESGGVFVHPSPWNGKEDWKGAQGAELSGIILIDRAAENTFSRVSPREAILPVLNALIHTAETEDSIIRLARFEDALLSRVPVYRLTSHEVPDSTNLLYENLFKEK